MAQVALFKKYENAKHREFCDEARPYPFDAYSDERSSTGNKKKSKKVCRGGKSHTFVFTVEKYHFGVYRCSRCGKIKY